MAHRFVNYLALALQQVSSKRPISPDIGICLSLSDGFVHTQQTAMRLGI